MRKLNRDYQAKPLQKKGAWLSAKVEVPPKKDIEFFNLKDFRQYHRSI